LQPPGTRPRAVCGNTYVYLVGNPFSRTVRWDRFSHPDKMPGVRHQRFLPIGGGTIGGRVKNGGRQWITVTSLYRAKMIAPSGASTEEHRGRIEQQPRRPG